LETLVQISFAETGAFFDMAYHFGSGCRQALILCLGGAIFDRDGGDFQFATIPSLCYNAHDHF